MAIGLVLGAALVIGSAGPARSSRSSAAEPPTLTQATFEACLAVRAWRVSAKPREASLAEKQFATLPAKTARTELAQGFGDAETKQERRAAFRRAIVWCSSQSAYRKTDLKAHDSEVVDTTMAAILGTTTPGAVVTANGVSTTANGLGFFVIELSGLHTGRNTVRLRASANLHSATYLDVVVTARVSESGFKASSAAISYDELVQNPDALVGRRVTSRARVSRHDSRTRRGFLASITQQQPGLFETWNDEVFLALPDAALGAGIEDGDIIEFWGTVTGSYEYETAGGLTNRVPAVRVKYLTSSSSATRQ